MQLGKQIRLLRIKRSLRQEDMAEKLGITSTYLSKIENCRKEPTLKLLMKIAKEFNVSLAFISKQEVVMINAMRRLENFID